jgi:hypothetical protein
VGTGADILWRKYGAVLFVLFLAVFGYLNLDVYCSFDVISEKVSYNAGEVVEINCTITQSITNTRAHGSLESELFIVEHIFWDVSHWDIPAYSTKTIYNTDAYASDTRTPIYYTLYGQTLRYPPE